MRDALESLTNKGITVAWASDMEYRAVWLPDERIAVLNARVSRETLAADLVLCPK